MDGTLAALTIENPANVDDIPKVDLHMHAETTARLDRLVSRSDNVPAHDWAGEVRALGPTCRPELLGLNRVLRPFTAP